MISKKSADTLLKLFAGETVIFYLKDMKISAISDDGEHVSFNGMIDGFVVDIDEYFFYLGDEDGNVDKAIGHSLIAIVEIAQYEPEIHVEMPSSDDEVH